MSIVFGIHKPAGATITRQELIRVASATARYAPAGASVAVQGQTGMGFQPYHTHKRSTLESHPLVDIQGNMLVLDGRIDNHAELSDLLNISDFNSPDSLIVLAAFQQWGEECFSRLIGDWALAIWANAEHALYLARDHAGTRTLYFEQMDETVFWSTHLETFFAWNPRRELNENYAACYLASQPLRDLTPYKSIKAVLPAHYVKLKNGVATHNAHWKWVATQTICYRKDREYDEHFLALFRQSVERRTGPGAPILAQLSGGMDSSSIVCVSDEQRIARGASTTDLLDTISFYDDSEPDWDERPYFSIIEAKRGKTGIHVDGSLYERTLEAPGSTLTDHLLPGRDASTIQREKFVDGLMQGPGYRVILSGIGGDEVLGGVPSPLPELADLFVRGNISSLFTRSIAWCLPDRMPLIHMLFRTAGYLSQLYLCDNSWKQSLPPWMCPRLRRLCGRILRDDVTRFTRLGHRPSSIDTGRAWWSIMETLPHAHPNLLSRYEYRYPYLDRDLVEFLFKVPRAQLLQPGRRRLLMRRALKGIVPEEILERRRKAFLSRNLVKLLESTHTKVATLTSESHFVAEGNLNHDEIARVLGNVIQRREGKWAQALIKTAFFLLWLNSTTTLLRRPEDSGLIAVGSLFAP